jgi:hypothetical protein
MAKAAKTKKAGHACAMAALAERASERQLRLRIADLLQRLDDCWSINGASVNVGGLQCNQAELRELRKLTADWRHGREGR